MSSEHAKIELKKSQQELKHLLIMAEIFVNFQTINDNNQHQQSIQLFTDNDIIKYYLNESERYINRIETLYNHCYEPWEGLERCIRDVMTKLREKQNQLYIMLDNNINNKRKQQQQQQIAAITAKTTGAAIGIHQPVTPSEQQQQQQQQIHHHHQQIKQHHQSLQQQPNLQAKGLF